MKPFFEELSQLSSSLTFFQFRLTSFLTEENETVGTGTSPDLFSLLEEFQAPLSTLLSLSLRAETLLRSRCPEDRTVIVKDELIIPLEIATQDEEVLTEEGQGSTEQFLLPDSDPEVEEDESTLILPHVGEDFPSVSQSIQPNQTKEKKSKVKRKRKQETGKDNDDDDPEPLQDLWPDIPKQPDGTYRCPFPPCEVKRLRYPSDLRKHMGWKHKDDLKATYGIRLEDLWHHKCGICGALRANKSALAQHEQSHKSEPSFHCMVCSSSFTRGDSFQRHLNLHAAERKSIAETPEQIGYQWLNCDICQAQFQRESSLRLHKKRQHPDSS